MSSLTLTSIILSILEISHVLGNAVPVDGCASLDFCAFCLTNRPSLDAMSCLTLASIVLSMLQMSQVLGNAVPVDGCASLDSCAACLANSACAWCVNKSRCTKQNCGNDNVIFPDNIQSLMSGAQFCPRLVPGIPKVFRSGDKEPIEIKLTQLYMYMAFTPWKCRITLNGQETIVKAVLLADKVYCTPFEFKNESEEPSLEGTVTVLWDFGKHLDGSVPFKVCNCTLDPICEGCKNKIIKH